MKGRFLAAAMLLFLLPLMLLSGVDTAAQKPFAGETEIVKPKNYRPLEMKDSAELKDIIAAAINTAVERYEGRSLKADDISVTVIDMSDAANVVRAEHRGEEKIYPASVVKMFYMAALYQQLEDGKIRMTTELERGLRDMIVDSSNEATQYIVDVLTNTASGGEMPQKEFELWSYRRNRMNRYFVSMGYTDINVNQKTHCEDAYGVEQQFRNYKGENRNMITTNATARLIAEIASGRIVNPKRSLEMMDVMKRDLYAEGRNANSQAVNFTGRAFLDRDIKDVKLWSKAGWTNSTRHDAAYFELPDGRKAAIAIYTVRHADEDQIIPDIAGEIIEKLRGKQ